MLCQNLPSCVCVHDFSLIRVSPKNPRFLYHCTTFPTPSLTLPLTQVPTHCLSCVVHYVLSSFLLAINGVYLRHVDLD
jgi:hypothetical protein